jgi:hypothetical protein
MANIRWSTAVVDDNVQFADNSSLTVNGPNNEGANLRAYGTTKVDNLCIGGSNARDCTNDGFMQGAWCGFTAPGVSVPCKGVSNVGVGNCPTGFIGMAFSGVGSLPTAWATCIKQ